MARHNELAAPTNDDNNDGDAKAQEDPTSDNEESAQEDSTSAGKKLTCSWSTAEEAVLLGVLRENCDKQSGTGFRSTVWKAAERRIKEQFPKKKGLPKTAAKCAGKWTKVCRISLLAVSPSCSLTVASSSKLTSASSARCLRASLAGAGATIQTRLWSRTQFGSSTSRCARSICALAIL